MTEIVRPPATAPGSIVTRSSGNAPSVVRFLEKGEQGPAGSSGLLSDVEANRPVSPSVPTEFLATDKKRLWRHDGSGRWYLVRDAVVPLDEYDRTASSGSTDCAALIESAMADLPAQDTSWNGWGRPDGGAIVLLSPGRVMLSRTAQLANKNFRIVPAGGLGSTRIILDPADASVDAFNVPAGWHYMSFADLMFDGGGVALTGDARGMHDFSRCQFTDTLSDAVRTLGQSVVGVSGDVLEFTGCNGSIGVNHANCDDWNLSRIISVRSLRRDVHIASSGVRISRVDFESRRTDLYAEPYVLVDAGIGDVTLDDLRFGDELSTVGGNDYGPPRDAVVVGPNDGTFSDSPTTQLRLLGIRARGTNGTPSATQADTAVRLTCPLQQSRIEIHDNDIYNTALIAEDFLTGASTAAQKSYGNVYEGSTRWRLQNKTFSLGGVGWRRDEARPGLGPLRVSTNELPATTAIDSSGSWIKTNCTIAKDATDPAGVASNAFTLTKTASGASATVRCGSSVASATGAAKVMSIKLKAGTYNFARLGLFSATSNKWLTSSYDTLALDSTWRRFAVRAPYVPAGHQVIMYVFAGSDAQDADSSTGTILLCEPQLEDGEEPSEPSRAADIQIFTAGGTWTKPSVGTVTTVYAIGAGGGGASGPRRASGTATSGGGGGAGGGLSVLAFRTADLSATEVVVVGAAGTAGAAVTANDTSGNVGVAGGLSSFASPTKVRAAGGQPGSAGGTTTANGGAGGVGTSAGGTGGTCSTGAAGGAGVNGSGAPGGGAGGGISTTPAAFAGGAGATGASTAAVAGTAGAINGNGGDGAANFSANAATPGAGAGGGGSSITGAGGTGGAGGRYGAGGGGGGASLNGQNSGAGGAGAGGIVIVITQ